MYHITKRSRPAGWFRGERWFWVLKSTQNGQVIATSEMYSSKQKRDQTVDAIAREFALAVRTDEL